MNKIYGATGCLLMLLLASYAMSGLFLGTVYAQTEPPPGTIGVGVQPQAEGTRLTRFIEHFSGGWDVVIYDGNLEFAGETVSTSLAWTAPFGAPSNDLAKTTFIMADGQSPPQGGGGDAALFNGATKAGPGSFPPVRTTDAFPGADPRLGASSDGGLWDTLTLDVTSLLTSGSTSATAAAFTVSDCLVWVAQVFGHGPPSNPAGYVAAGASLRNQPSGVITITGIPDGSEVTGAFLYFTVLASYGAPTPTMTINGIDVSSRAVAIGSGPSPCWVPIFSFSFRYDVKDRVEAVGNGAYTLTGYPTSDTSNADPWSRGCFEGTDICAEGASLVVLYDPKVVGGTVLEANPTAGPTGLGAGLPWLLLALVVTGAVAYTMRRRFGSTILAKIK